MFCDRCGAENKDTAAFCRKCGQALESTEVETRVVSRNREFAPPVAAPLEPSGREDPADEATLFTITPTVLFVKIGYVLAAVGALLLVALAAALTSLPTLYAVILGLLLFAIPAYFHVRQRLIHYSLHEANLEISTGLIATTTRSVPLRRIQDVTVSATVLQRLLSLGDIVIDNASEEGGKLVLRNIDSARRHADVLLKQISKLDRT